MTLAERYRQERPTSWKDPTEWAKWLLDFDPTSGIQATDLGPIIQFSDGSQHLMDRE